ncbi:hypothetical protein F1C16_02955 [Hymenobacter sp. NBH84]|uniref:Arm DNA-binding domain-containing protein n=1 Tax=Hymenobacter sp. NBH84 TaxID=2596915 RepID=UPI0016275ED1|nr:Arm DNA-binding domain-containing protein [Hymenobacter sp. NBH84]QNE38582.1 hypothetical protein F1C16_02955 [Hymenobacter sp. NBH84]
MEITRQLRKDKINKKGFAPIQVTVCWEGNRLRVATGERVRPEHWDEEAKRVRAVPGSYNTRINPKLDKLHNVAEQTQQTAYEQQQRLLYASLLSKPVVSRG